jgi:recombination protein RecA
VKVVKNKVAPPFRIAEFDIMSANGISREGGVLDVALDLGIISRAGAFFKYGATTMAQGREAAKTFLKENPKIVEELTKKIYDKAKAGKVEKKELGVEEEE